MSAFQLGAWLLTVATLMVGCAQTKVVTEKSLAMTHAERLESRASRAYAKGDREGAVKDFQTAAQIYESLAMGDAAASVQLSLARIDADEGRARDALERVNGVLGLAQQRGTSISTETALLANGRAAALYLQQHDVAAAHSALTAAERLCASTCDAASALLALRANWALATGDAAGAKAAAASALAQSRSTSDKANALRSLAESGLALNQWTSAAGDAEQALRIDQEQGSALRVVADLDLLASIYAKAGHPEQAAAYRARGQAAKDALKQLGGK